MQAPLQVAEARSGFARWRGFERLAAMAERGRASLSNGNKKVIWSRMAFFRRGALDGTDALRGAVRPCGGSTTTLSPRGDIISRSGPTWDHDQNEPLGAIACAMTDRTNVLERNIVNRAGTGVITGSKLISRGVALRNLAPEQSLVPQIPMSFSDGEGMTKPSPLAAAKAGTNGEEDITVKLYARRETFLGQTKERHATFTDCYAVLEKITDSTPGKGDGS